MQQVTVVALCVFAIVLFLCCCQKVIERFVGRLSPNLRVGYYKPRILARHDARLIRGLL